MTDIENRKKALALLNEVRAERGLPAQYGLPLYSNPFSEALCRAIEQHEAFRQEVSDAVESLCNTVLLSHGHRQLREMLSRRFIIAKPDLLVEVIATALREGSPFCEDGSHSYMDEAKVVAAAIKKRGGKIVWEND